MAISYIETPQDLRRFAGEESEAASEDLELTLEGVEHLAEIFQTPLTGAYNWDYTVQDDRVKRLYELGKQLNWNAEVDIPWNATPDWRNRPPITDEQREMVSENRKNSPFAEFAPYKALDADQVIEVGQAGGKSPLRCLQPSRHR